jgi:hypothetical protein
MYVISKNNNNGATSKKALILFALSAFFKLCSNGTPSEVKIFCVSVSIKKGRLLNNRPSIIYNF